MFKCTYCGRELKSKSGKVRHENSCKSKNEVIMAGLDVDEDGLLVTVVEEVVQLEVMGGEETYYDGHPRRLDKLRGLLNRTFDPRERNKITKLIMESRNGTK